VKSSLIRWMGPLLVLVVVSLGLTTCGPTSEPQVVEKVVKETVIVPGTPEVVTQEATRIVTVEKVVTATSEPAPEPELEEATVTVAVSGVQADVERVYTIMKGFSAAHPNIKVEVQAIEASGFDAKLLSEVAAGTAPDVFMVGPVIAGGFIEKGAFLDLTPYIEDDEIGIDTSQFYPEIYKVGVVDGDTYLLTKDFATLATHINTALFDAAGIPYPEEDWTYDDLIDICQELTLDANGNNAKSPDFNPDKIVQWGADQASPWSTFYDFLQPFFFGFGGSNISPDGKKATGYMDSEQMALAVEFYRDLMHKYHCVPTAAAVQAQGGADLFGAGLSAIKLNFGPWGLAGYLADPDLKFAIVPMPSGPAGHHNVLSWAGWGVFSGTKHPREAYLVARELGTEPGVRVHAEFALASMPKVNEELGKAGDPYWGQFVREISYAQAPEGMRNSKYPECIATPFTAQITEVIAAEDGADFDPRPALAALAGEADACLEGQ
jgi:multiple sugar transport system substrate-binding protein